MEPLQPADPAEIGGYPLIARLGAGGMGQVYLGAADDGRHIALKVIREGFDDPQALARFRREVATVERVRSRYAASMVGAGLEAPPYWLATEYVPGPTLRQAVAGHGPLPPRTALALLAALAQGLLEIHRQGVQHRDLKPANVILAPDGPRLIDFGIARGEDQTQITRTGGWNGTPGYVAPEVVREQAPLPASDVFSLAVTVGYAATGRSPFGSGPLEAVIHRTLNGEPDLAGSDPFLAAVLTDCLAKDPAERPDPAALLARCGAPDLAGDPAYRELVSGTEPPPTLDPARPSAQVPPVPPRSRRRSRLLMPVAAAGSAVVTVGVGLLVLQFLPGSADGSEGKSGRTGTATPSNSATGQGPGQGSGAPTAAASPPPDKIQVQADPGELARVRWNGGLEKCEPALRTEADRPGDWFMSSSPVTSDRATIGMQFSSSNPRDYYLVAEVRPGGNTEGVIESGIVRSKPRRYPGSGLWVNFEYPRDFQWPGAGSTAFELTPGDWTVIWYHVHSDGTAFFANCHGFTVQ